MTQNRSFIDTRTLPDSFELDDLIARSRGDRIPNERFSRERRSSNSSISRDEVRREIESATAGLSEQIKQLTSMVRAMAQGCSPCYREGNEPSNSSHGERLRSDNPINGYQWIIDGHRLQKF